MAERYQHHRFIGGDLLQTRRDQKRFCQAIATSDSTVACFAASRENHIDGLNILFVFIMDLVQASLKAAAVSGIFMIWANFTIEAFKFSWHIATTSPEKETLKVIRKAVCENCGNVYNDDDFDVIIERCLCFDCRV